MLQMLDLGPDLTRLKIKIIGIGNSGVNAINYMQGKLDGVQFIAADTDCQKLASAATDCKIILGSKRTGGRGTGGNPQIGMEAAQESEAEIRDGIGEETPLLFIVTGLGGGTGTGAGSVVARIAAELGVLTISAATLPAANEGRVCLSVAEEGVVELRKQADCLLLFNNERQIQLSHNNQILDMLNAPYDRLCKTICGITEIVTKVGHINIDLADMNRVMRKSGLALMGVGEACGENRAREATEQAITSPLQNDVSIEGAQRVLYNITASASAGYAEVSAASNLIREKAPDAVIIQGLTISEDNPDLFHITVIATGLDEGRNYVREPAPFKFDQPAVNRRDKDIPPPQEKIQRQAGHMMRRPSMFTVAEERRSRQGQPQIPGLGGDAALVHKPGSTVFTYDRANPESPSFMRLLPD